MDANGKTHFRVDTFTPGDRAWGIIGRRETLVEALELVAQYDDGIDIVRVVRVTELVLEV